MLSTMVSGTKKPRVVGIDLGTSNTLAAWVDGRLPRAVPTERGGNLLPSVVAFAGERVLVGQPAKEQLLINPEETIYGSKRLMGRPFHSPQVRLLQKKFAYNIVEGPDGYCAVRAGGRVRDLTEISGVLLEQISRYAHVHLGGSLDGVVISVPAYYPLPQREAVKRAAKAAGLDVWRLVNEPTAAALAYGAGKNLSQKVLVFDLGGGTFDVSILEIDGGTYQVLATGGDGFLGGVDFDIRLTDHLIERFESEEGVSIRDDAVVVQRVLNAAEAAKIDLSLLQHAEVRLPFVAQRRGKPVDMLLHVSRSMLLSLTDDLVERCANTVDDVLDRARLHYGDIDEVLLAGGQTRMPAIQARLEKQFGKSPRKGVNADEVVAQGAAILASSLASGGSDARLLDVLSLPIGIGRKSPTAMLFEPISSRNAALPLDAKFEATTSTDDQTAITVDLFQGFARDIVSADYVGTVHYEGLAPMKAGAQRVQFQVALDAEGMMEVKAAQAGGAWRRLPIVAGVPNLGADSLDDPTHSGVARNSLIGSSTTSQTGDAEKPSLLKRLFRRGG